MPGLVLVGGHSEHCSIISFACRASPTAHGDRTCACPTLERNASNPQGWQPSPRPIAFSLDSSISPPGIASGKKGAFASPSESESPMFTAFPSGPAVNEGKRKRAPLPGSSREIGESASPHLKKSTGKTMKRTPQPALAQSRLTCTGGTLKLNTEGSSEGPSRVSGSDPQRSGPASVNLPGARTGEVPIMTLAPAWHTTPSIGVDLEPLTADFFRKLIGENMDRVTKKIDAMAIDLAALTKSVDQNKLEISKGAEEARRQASLIEEQKFLIDRLGERVDCLETGTAFAPLVAPAKASKSASYLRARRSHRFWPINRTDEGSLWNGVGEFIHSALGLSEDEICQEDIEAIVAVPDARVAAGTVNSEATVTFFCQRKRDTIMSKVSNLSSYVDDTGKPTAGVRLEVPPELDYTFRLLSRLRTRLRARHGEGTRRHVKFDDHEASMYLNVKLPGDTEWTRVTPEMAKIDLGEAARAESAKMLKRMKAVTAPGPRQRLVAPVPPRNNGQRRWTGSQLKTQWSPTKTLDPTSWGQSPSIARASEHR